MTGRCGRQSCSCALAWFEEASWFVQRGCAVSQFVMLELLVNFANLKNEDEKLRPGKWSSKSPSPHRSAARTPSPPQHCYRFITRNIPLRPLLRPNAPRPLSRPHRTLPRTRRAPRTPPYTTPIPMRRR